MALLLSALLLSGCASSIISSGVLAGARVYSQERSLGNAIDDLTIETAINHRYFRTDISDLFQNVDADVLEGRVLLTGSVRSQQTKIRAVDLAWQVKGVREVINELHVSGPVSLGVQGNDLWITTQIEGHLLITKGIHSANYNVETEKGIVTLMGIAQNAEELHKATTIASRVEGVKQVVSHVMLKDDPRRFNPLTPQIHESGPLPKIDSAQPERY